MATARLLLSVGLILFVILLTWSVVNNGRDLAQWAAVLGALAALVAAVFAGLKP